MGKKPSGQFNVIGSAIKAARDKLKISQEELARKLNKTQTTICRWEIGQNVPNVQNILKLEEFLGSLPKPPNRGRDTFDILPIIRSFEGVKLKSITPIQFKQIIDICRPLQNPVSKLLLQELIENITTSDKSS